MNVLQIVQKWMHDNWIWMGSVSYVYVSCVGMIQSWMYFDTFGINVFEFAEINDFLIAAFRKPFSFVCLIIFLFFFLIYAIIIAPRIKSVSSTWSKNGSQCDASKSKIIPIILFVLWIVISLLSIPYLVTKFLDPININDQLKVGEYEILFRIADNYKSNVEYRKKLFFLGTTDKYAFFAKVLNSDGDGLAYETYIAPVGSIVLMRGSVLPINEDYR